MPNASHTKLQGALITPPGYGGIAIIQVTGAEVLDLASKIFVSVNNTAVKDMVSRHIYLGDIYEADRLIDQVMLIIDRDRSDIYIHCHGGPRIVQRIMVLLDSMQVDILSWQDMSVDNNIASEAAYVLSFCKSELAVKAIAAQSSSGLAAWCENIINLIDSDKPGIDYLLSQIDDLSKTWSVSKRLLSPPKVFIVGPPNAGKSSLANALTGRGQSLVSDIPGTTRDWTSEFTEINGIAIELIDTAGRRETDDHFESISLERLSSHLIQAEMYILLIPVDYSGDFDALYQEQTRVLPEDSRLITVFSKSDKCSEISCNDSIDLSLSLVNDTGVMELRDMLTDRLGFGTGFDYIQPLIFTERQYELVSRALNCDCLEQLRDVISMIKGQ